MEMVPGGGVYKEVVESFTKPVKYDAGMAKMEKYNAPSRNVVGSVKYHRISLTNGVHELLECRDCTSLMCPTIYQGKLFILFAMKALLCSSAVFGTMHEDVHHAKGYTYADPLRAGDGYQLCTLIDKFAIVIE